MKFSYGKFQTFILCFYLISGEIKFLFVYYGIPIDITIAAGILVVGDLLYNLTNKDTKLKLDTNRLLLITLLLLFYLVMIFSLSYTPSDTFGLIKTSLFLLTILAFIYPLFVKNVDIDFFAKIILYTTIPAALWFIVVKHLYWTGFKSQIGEHFEPLLGAYIGLSINVVFLIFYYTIINKKLKVVLGLLVLILALGSRGALLFALLILLMYRHKVDWPRFGLKFRLKVSKVALWIFVLVLPGILLARNTIMEGFRFGLARFESLQNFGQDNSSNERLEFYRFAISKIPDSFSSFFFGYGVGSFGTMFNGIDSKTIPHNLILESLFEFGLFGTIFLVAFLTLPFLLKNRLLIFRLMALFFLLDSMKSGGLQEMRYMFGVFGCLIFMEVNTSKNALTA